MGAERHAAIKPAVKAVVGLSLMDLRDPLVGAGVFQTYSRSGVIALPDARHIVVRDRAGLPRLEGC